MQKGETIVSGDFAKKVSIGSENLFSTQYAVVVLVLVSPWSEKEELEQIKQGL